MERHHRPSRTPGSVCANSPILCGRCRLEVLVGEGRQVARLSGRTGAESMINWLSLGHSDE